MPVFLSMYILGICEHEEENDEEKWLFYPCTSSTGKGSTELERKGIINTTFWQHNILFIFLKMKPEHKFPFLF